MTTWIVSIDPKLLDFWKLIGTVVVALIAAGIAGAIQFQQWRTASKSATIAQNKLKLDLFILRNEVFLAGHDLIDDTLNDNFTPDTRNKFWRTVGKSEWLFGTDEIQRYYTEELFPQVKRFAELARLIQRQPEADRLLSNATDELIQWAKKNSGRHREMFQKYMVLTHEIA